VNRFRTALDGKTAPLEAAPLRGPIDEPLHLIAVLPHQVEELARVQASCFRSEKGLEPPAQVGAFPRIQTITASDNPVVPQHLPHLTYVYRAGSLHFLQTKSFSLVASTAPESEANVVPIWEECKGILAKAQSSVAFASQLIGAGLLVMWGSLETRGLLRTKATAGAAAQGGGDRD